MASSVEAALGQLLGPEMRPLVVHAGPVGAIRLPRCSSYEDLDAHSQAGRTHGAGLMTQRRYLIVIEGGDDANYSAYAPDVPGCVATAATLDECGDGSDAVALSREAP